MTEEQALVRYLITVGGRTYRLDADDETDDILQWYIESKGKPEKLVGMSRQQVLARIGRSTLPVDFADPDMVIGDENREAAHTRGWFETTVTAWETGTLAEPAADQEVASTPQKEATTSADPEPAGTPDGSASSGPAWTPRTRLWSEVPLAADDRVAIISSRGAVAPSGKVLAGQPMPGGHALGRFLASHWPRSPKFLPQLWLTYEALEGVGFAVDDSDGPITTSSAVSHIVESVFDCKVSNAKAGWFTCRFAGDRKAYVVLVPLMHTDPSSKRPQDMGLAGYEDSETELPEAEFEAVKLLGDRIGWLASLADGVAPASRWSTVGAALLDSVRRRGRQTSKSVEECPYPADVAVESGGDIEPAVEPQWNRRPHRSRSGKIDVEVDQRAAYLASAVQVELGYGKPKEVSKIDASVFAEQKPPYGLWRLTTPPVRDLDGLTTKLPRPHAAMQWEKPSTFWLTTRGVQQLAAPVEFGGAGLSIPELAIDAAWIWPQQGRLLRTWADALRARLLEARDSGREDYQDFIKAIYTTYLGRMASDQWQPSQKQHHQPTWYATIRADTRWRAMRYARHIADTHNLYPVQAELDAWIYLVDPDQDLSIFNEASNANGKYRVKWSRADETDANGDGT
ncbi:hypothetical protein DE4576_04935 [Mycobacterium marinum]|uniref:hypothetical protein n=1 Tax=Mycobacterium marinum TaxID=1781 RepID=UPI000E3E15F7|nr:hypothetical protein [Mycobacterium marinum]RFZ62996.1 hypothetical protein DE4576_04935 [Mycobacterium marinum]